MAAVTVTGVGATAAHETLDIPEKQILLYVEAGSPAQPSCYWHHILWARVEGSRWVCTDPMMDTELLDLATEGLIIPLPRKGQFPLPGRPFYAFPVLREEEVTALRARAMQIAEALGVIPSALIVQSEANWLFSDTAHPLFNTAASATALGSANTFMHQGSVGCVRAAPAAGEEPRWTSIERVKESDRSDWLLEKREGAGRDRRILKVPDLHGRAPRFAEAIPHVDKAATLSPMFEGVHITKEVVAALAKSGMEPAAFCAEFYRSSGLGARSGLGIEYWNLIFMVYIYVCVDGLDPLHSAAIEHACRRIIQIQRAVKANPKQPDFSSGEAYMLHCEAASGSLHTPEFDKWVTERQKTQTAFMKQSRMAREEADSLAKSNKK